MSDVDTLNTNEADLSEFKKLQKRLNHESIKTQFRTKAFGGLHEEDVTRYIEDLEDKFKKLEQENKKASDEVFALRTRLNKELEDKDSLLINLDELKQDVNSYMTECKQKEADINSLKENSNSVCVLMKSDIHKLTEEKQELEKTLNEYYQNIEQIKSKISDLEYQNIQLEKENSLSISEKDELEGRLALSCNEVLKYKNNIVVFENENNTLRTRVNELEKDNLQISELNNKVLKLNEEQTMLGKLLNESNSELIKAKACAEKFENENEVLISRVTELEKEALHNPELYNEILKLKEERSILEIMLNESNSELINTKAYAEKFEIENKELVSKITELEKDASELNNEILKLNEERTMLEKLLSDSDNELLSMKESHTCIENEKEELKAKVFELTNEISRLYEDRAMLEKLLNEADSEITQSKEDASKLSDELKVFEELLYQSNVEYEKIKENAVTLEKENANLKEQVVEIEKNVSSKDYKINEINRVCMDLKNQIEIEKSCSEKLNMDLVIFKQKIVSLQETINEKLQELEEQKNKNEKQEIELNKERAALLSYKVNGFKEEFSDMYKKIDNLEYEATQYLKSSSILQKQLVKEQNRADKAENDLASLMAMLTGVKDKFNNDQSLIEDEMEQLVEKQEQEKHDSIISLDTLKKIKSN